MSDYEVYQSPLSWRYGSNEMRQIWSEAHKRRLWRRIWVALAETEAEEGLVSPDQLEDLRRHAGEVDIPRAVEIEAQLKHDLMAELTLFAKQAPIGGAILHLGATSTDVEDNADALRMRQSMDLLRRELDALLDACATQIERWAELPIIGFTHMQPAEPTTLGYRLAYYAQDLLAIRSEWASLSIQGKGFKGAVGTSAAYQQLIPASHLPAFEQRLSDRLGIPFFPITTQVYPRRQDYTMLSSLAGLGAVLHKFAFDFRILQSPAIGEWSEPFGSSQVGSSAMPFKRNPINAEKIDSLARQLAQFPRRAWDDTAFSLLERTLDDSADRRSLLPEACLLTEELLITATRLVSKFQVDQNAVAQNLETYGPFAAVEPLMMALVRAGASRQSVHETLRQLSMRAWEAIKLGQPNPLSTLASSSQELLQYLTADQIHTAMNANNYTGAAAPRALQLAAAIRAQIHAV
jgi:adenylosuccinate lyase